MRTSCPTLLQKRFEAGFHVCVGLDLDPGKIPHGETFRSFGLRIAELTAHVAAAFKINFAFPISNGWNGMKDLGHLIEDIHRLYPEIPVILDVKVADIGNTNVAYGITYLHQLKADSITVHMHHGVEAMQPFLDEKAKTIFCVVRTSNPGAHVNQDRSVIVTTEEQKRWRLGDTYASEVMTFYQVLALQVRYDWNEAGNCGIVLGATNPEQLEISAKLIGPDIPILIPGIGAQGGDLAAVMQALQNAKHDNFLINSSRGIIFDPQPGAAAELLHEQIRDLGTVSA